MATFGDILVVLTGWGQSPAGGLWWVQAVGAAKHPTVHRAAPVTKQYPVPSVCRAEAEEPCALQPLFSPFDRQETGSPQTFRNCATKLGFDPQNM